MKGGYPQHLRQVAGHEPALCELFCTDVHCTDQQHRQDKDGHVLDVLTSLVESSISSV